MRFRYSLRTLLLVTLAVGVGFGAYLKWTENERSIAALEHCHATYHWHTRTKDGLSRALAPDEQYASVEFRPDWDGPSSVARSLRGLTRLKTVTLTLNNFWNRIVYKAKVLDRETVRAILPLPAYEELVLRGDLEEQSWELLVQHPRLRILRASGEHFTPRELEILAGLPRLEELHLSDCLPADRKQGLPELARLTRLQALTIDRDWLDEETQIAIGRLPKLERLTVYDLFRDHLLPRSPNFAWPPNLRTLRLGVTHLPESELKFLAEIPHLEELRVSRLDFEDPNFEKLGQHLPKLRRYIQGDEYDLFGSGPRVYVRGPDGTFRQD